MDADTLQKVSSALQALLTSAAIVVGGLWTYGLFIRQRLRFPRVELSLAIDCFDVPAKKRIVHAALHVRNSGSVLLPLNYAELRLRQVIPIPKEIPQFERGNDPVLPEETELPWPALAQREWRKPMELEPGECETLHADFVIETEILVVEFYAFVPNRVKPREKLGWSMTMMYNFAAAPRVIAE